MDPKHLMEDELNYEFSIRQIRVEDADRLERLKRALAAEQTAGPQVDARITRQSISNEVKVCGEKLTEIEFEMLEVLCGGYKEALVGIMQSRLMHIEGRLVRLQQFDPTHIPTNDLMSRLQRIRNDIVATIGISHGDTVENNIQVFGPIGAGAVKNTGTTPKTGVRYNVAAQDLSLLDTPPLEQTQHSSMWQPSPIPRSENHLKVQWPNQNSGAKGSNLTAKGNFVDAMPGKSFNDFSSNGRTQTLNQTVPNSWGYRDDARSNQDANNMYANPLPRAVPRSEFGQGHSNSLYQDQGGAGFPGGHRIHNWSLRYDGGANGLEAEDFVFRVERQAQLYGVANRTLVIGIGELLRGRAAQWYWTFQREHGQATWNQLKEAFLRRYAPNRESDLVIRSKIESRKQQQGESFNDFCQDVEALNVRLIQRLSTKELVEVLHQNMVLSLRKAFFRERPDTVDEMLRLCSEYEKLCEEEAHQAGYRRQKQVSEVFSDQFQLYEPSMQHRSEYDMVNNRIEALKVSEDRNNLMVCWNCKDLGHVFTQCPQQKRSIFCYSCGMSGVLKSECQKCSLNGRKGQMSAVVSRPSQHTQPRLLSHPATMNAATGNRNPFLGNPNHQ